MAKDNPPLRLVGQRAAPRWVQSHKTIEEWVAERKAALDGLLADDRVAHVQLQLGEVA